MHPDSEVGALEDLRSRIDELQTSLNDIISNLLQRVARVQHSEHDLQQRQESWEQECINFSAELENEKMSFQTERNCFEAEKRQVAAVCAKKSDIISLNVGGEKCVQRRRSTLCAVEGSLLATRFSGRWEQLADLDEQGRHFINYPPEVFMPILDYLNMKETEDPECPAPFPQGPEGSQPLFQAMLEFYGLQPPAIMRCLDALQKPYEEVINRHCGLAFEVHSKGSPLALKALETCSLEHDCSATIYFSEGALASCLMQKDSWVEIGSGPLLLRRASRIELKPSVLQPHSVCCIYIAADNVGVAFHYEKKGSTVSAENTDLQICRGVFSDSSAPFLGFKSARKYMFNGKLEYMLADGPSDVAT